MNLAAKSRREQALLVNGAPDGHVSPLEIRVGHVLEISEREGIVQVAVLLELLDVISPLHSVHHHVAAVVGAVKQVARLIEIETPGIAAPFAE